MKHHVCTRKVNLAHKFEFKINLLLHICFLLLGKLFGVFDGHAGPSCAQIICKRLMRYIASGLVSSNILREQLKSGAKSNSFLQCHNDKVDFVSDVNEIYEKSFSEYARNLCYEDSNNFQTSIALQNAFLQLDKDIATEALGYRNPRTMSVAMSGAVACVVYIDGIDIHIASSGDCAAVLGSINESGEWETTRLTNEHNSDNLAEVKRITGHHPLNERETVIRGERLLGQLAPLRAFGDYRYKWSIDILQKYVVPIYGEQVIPPNYFTPPYLTAEPEISYHSLTPKDRFLIIASDGIWDFMSPTEAVKLVGEHMIGKIFLQPFFPKRNVTLKEVAQMLSQRRYEMCYLSFLFVIFNIFIIIRRNGLKQKPLDKNGATHLIRHALGGTDYGIEHSKLSHMLSLPADVVRLFRDDMTATVIYFNQEFIRNAKP